MILIKKISAVALCGGVILIACALGVYLKQQNTKLAREMKEQKSNLEQGIEKLNKENVEIKSNYAIMQNNYARLQKDHQELVQSHEVLTKEERDFQSQKERVRKLAAYLEKVEKDKEALEKQKESAVDESFAAKEQVRLLEDVKKQLLTEKEQMQETLVKVGDKSGALKLEKEKSALQKDNNELLNRLKQVDADLKRVSEKKDKSEAEVKELSEKLDTLNCEYAEVARKNKAFEEKVANDPKKFAEIAHQNRVLIRRTANMHYNLGVFYAEKKQYSRAIAEYQKCLELTPDDAYAHFNLGYLYAEYEINRNKAVEHFRHYLRLAKEEDKDVDWVKKYLLTWESYEGKKPIE